MKEPVEHVTTTEARGASNRKMNRHALVFGIAIIVVIFAIIFLIGAW
jgi:hypothetical protein